MRRITAESRPGIRELTKGHKPGETLVRVDLDPYYRSFRNVTTHILAPELTERAMRAALQQGHAFVSHDWMCDATGFSVIVAGGASAGQVLLGDEVPFASGQKLLARFPVGCHIRLFRNGKVLAESNGDQVEQALENAGVYRVEGWLRLDGEDRPWIYSNPIYLR